MFSVDHPFESMATASKWFDVDLWYWQNTRVCMVPLPDQPEFLCQVNESAYISAPVERPSQGAGMSEGARQGGLEKHGDWVLLHRERPLEMPPP
jgi:hypothetical protein